MRRPEGEDRFVVVALLDELTVGSMIDRHRWPPHVTVAPNFAIAAPDASLERAVRVVFAEEAPVEIRFGARAMFGPNEDIAVQLVESDRFTSLHTHLAAVLNRVPGFAADEPAYWGSG